ncbi:hypothetical protein C265_27319 [Cupriavidus sp. GA3-3]|nr:hypothetical protein C265_27319 [Cupriavidus sp. GA3-3]
MSSNIAEQERLTIGYCPRHVLAGDAAVGTGTVIDDDVMPQQSPKPGTNKMRHKIVAASGTGWYDDPQ